ncbi:MAG: autotransporter-associated beta strand repeat-containing protein [Gemmataceae bacterium]|nr:autotransporter-associated beta strand repeat-containing protein [Gemmataceae bacterium]
MLRRLWTRHLSRLHRWLKDDPRHKYQARTDRPTIRKQPRLELLEDRLAPAAWLPQGPGPARDGQVENISPNDEVVGAMHTVVAHPTNADILYVGGTNGGIWKTTNATAASPTWSPLIDQQSSLSIGALELDPTDGTHQTLVAGVGLYSSYFRDGGQRTGLLRTTDGGATWTEIDGGGVLDAKNISGVAARGNTIVVSVNDAEPFFFSNVGIFRSTNGGASFTQISEDDGDATGLPGGVSYDLASDPTNPNVLYTSVVFSAVVGGQVGVYKSTDTGATWTKVSNAAMDALIDNGTTNRTGTSNLEIAVGSNNNVYVGIVNSGRAAGIFRSGDGGANWAQMDTPTTNENGTDVGLNPSGGKGPGPGSPPAELAGGQGAIHFSLRADPNNANIVYVGGDRQPLSNGDTGGFPNSINAFDFSGRLFRGDASAASGSQWVHLTHSSSHGAAGGGTASSSAPHADSREMVFDANGNLIEVDDGGIYRRTNPQNNTGDWFSIIGNLQVTEMHDVAYDTLSNIIISGNQDTGTTYQNATASATWLSLHTADGGDVSVDNITLSASNQSIRYSSFQNLGFFRRTVWNSSGGLVSQNFPALTVSSGAALARQFKTPVELNSINPQRMIIGGANFPYESLNSGTTIVQLSGTGLAGVSIFGPIAYGGIISGSPNENLLYVGSGNQIFTRTGSGTSLTASGFAGGDVRDITIDTDDGASAFAIDEANRVWRTTNIGADWTEITGNLPAAGAAGLFSLEFIAGPGVDLIVVGSQTGVFVATSLDFSVWREFGAALPNVPVYDLDYDAADDVLVAGTLGRGAWLLPNASELTTVQLSSGNLIVSDPNGKNDNITIRKVGGNVRVTDPTSFVAAGAGVTQIDANTVEVPLTSITGNIQVGTGTGNDTLTLDYTSASLDLLPGGGLVFDGGENTGDDDRLVVAGYNAATVQVIHTGTDSGTVQVASDGQVQFSNIEPLTLGGTAANLIINLPAGSTDAVLFDDGGPTDDDGVNDSGFSAIDGAGFEFTEFANPSDSLQIVTAGGSSVVTINAADSAFAPLELRLSGPAGDVFRLGAANVIPDGTSLTVNTARFDLDGKSETTAGLNGNGVVSNDAASSTSTLTIAGTNASTFSGAIQDGGSGRVTALTKAGSGTLILSGVNTYSGTTTINAGTLQVAGGAALPNTGVVSIANAAGAVLDVNGTNEAIGALNGGGTGGGQVALGSGTLTVGNTAIGAGSFAGIISGAGSLHVTSSYRQTLSGANTYQGGTQITSGGIIDVASDANLGNAAGGITFDSGTIQASESLSTSRAITLNNAIGSGGGFGVASGKTVTLNGAIGGPGGFTKSDAGTLIIANAGNSYQGGTTLIAGVLEIGSDGNLGAAGGGVQLLGGTLGITENVATARPILVNNIVSVAAVNVAPAKTLTLGGAVTDASGSGGDPSGFTKAGAGTLILAASNTYTGATTINLGTVLVHGSLSSVTAAVTVNANSVLGGTGTISRPINVSGGTLAPGASTGILNTGNVSFTSSSIFLAEINANATAGADYDQLNAAGMVTLNGAELTLTGAITATTGPDILLINATGGVSGQFGDMPEGTLVTVNGRTFQLTYAGGDGNDVALRTPVFTAGEVFAADGDAGGPREFMNVSAGGNLAAAAVLATLPGRALGQIAWSPDLMTAYVTINNPDQVVAVAANGTVTTYATGIPQPMGLVMTRSARLLVGSFQTGSVYDITGGGDFTTAIPFATGLLEPRNFLQLPDGTVLVAERGSGEVTALGSGGNLSSAAPFAFGLGVGGPTDLARATDGRIFVSSTSASAVLNITAGGDFSSATPFATGRAFAGLTVDGAGRLLAFANATNTIYDISAGGDFSTASPWASNLPLQGATALDTVPAAFVPRFTQVDLNGADNLVITDTAPGGKDDALTIQSNGTHLIISDPGSILTTAIAGAGGNNTDTLTIPIAAVTGGQVHVNTLQGNDSVTVDFSLGTFTLPIFTNGGDPSTGPGDRLTTTGGSFTTITHTLINAHDGSIAFGGQSAAISYTGLEPVDDNNAADHRVFTFTGGAETITLTDVGGADGNNRIDSDLLGEMVTFPNPTLSLTIQTAAGGGTGADTINIEGVDAAFDADLIIDGDGDDTINFQTNPTDIGTGNLTADAMDIFLDETFTTDGGTVVLAATNDIFTTDDIVTSGGDVTLNSDSDSAGSGRIVIDGLIMSGGGDIVLGGGADPTMNPARGDAGRPGIDIDDLGGGLNAGAGNISIRGRGGDDGSGERHGIEISDDVLSTSGSITLVGTGGASSGNTNGFGVGLFQGAVVSSASGNINVTGVGGGGTGNQHRGVNLNDNSTFQVGTGNMIINATGGGGNSEGLRLSNDSDGNLISTGSGSITVTATASGNDVGIDAGGDSVIGGPTATGPIFLIADSMDLFGALSVQTAGTATLRQLTNGVAINLGGADVVGVLGLTDAELDRVTAGVLKIGDANSGAMTISADISRTGGVLSLQSGSTITENVGADIAVATASGSLALRAVGAITLDQGNAVGNLAATTTSGGITYVEGNAGGAVAISGASGVDGLNGVTTANAPISISTTNGTITVNAASTVNAGNSTVQLSAGQVSTASSITGTVVGAGGVTIVANNLTISTVSGSINAGTAIATLRPATAGTAINLGTATGALDLTDAELDRVSAATVNLGDSVTGTVTISAPIQHGGDAGFVTTGHSIVFNTGTSWTTTHGNLTFAANQTLTPSDGDGIDINGAIVTTQGTGDLLFQGQSGSASGNGISVRGGGDIRSTATGATAGGIRLEGTGRAATDSAGVSIDGAGSSVTSVEGAIQVVGVATTASGLNSRGVQVSAGARVESTGTGVNAATIFIQGTGGVAVSTNYGIFLESASVVTTIDGDIQIAATGGAAGTNFGLLMANGAAVTATGTADINVDGTGGSAGSSNHGVIGFNPNTKITAVDGNISVTGTPGAGGNTFGIFLLAEMEISTSGAGHITLSADSMNFDDTAVIDAGMNTVTLVQETPENSIVVGGLDGELTLGLTDAELDRVSAGVIHVGNADTGTITVTNSIQHLGDDNFVVTTGRNIVVTAGASWTTTGGDLTFSANQQATPTSGNFVGIDIDGGTITTNGSGDLLLQGRGGDATLADQQIGIGLRNGGVVSSTGAGTVTLIGQGGNGDDNNAGVSVEGDTSDVIPDSMVTSATGDIQITGVATGFGQGVWINFGGIVSSTGTAKINIDGTGGPAYAGVEITRALVTSVDGAIDITGAGGNGVGFAFEVGVYIHFLGSVTSTGLATITIHGTGGAGVDAEFAYGVDLEDEASITSTIGAINITGVAGGGGVTSSGDNVGVFIYSSVQIASFGSAPITIVGTGGAGVALNYGVEMLNGASIASVDGPIHITGHGGGSAGGNDNAGVLIFDDADVIATGSASILIEGIGGLGDFNDDGVEVTGLGTQVTAHNGNVTVTGTAGGGAGDFGFDLNDEALVSTTGSGNVTVTADSINIDATATIDVGTNTVTLIQETVGTLIDLGGADVLGTLGLTGAELDRITAGTLTIGDSASGNIDVTSPIDLTDGPSIAVTNLTTGAAVLGSGGNVLTAHTLNVSAPGGIGAGGDPLSLNTTAIDTDSLNTAQFLSEADTTLVTGLDAGNATIHLLGGAFTSSAAHVLADASSINVDSATLAIGPFDDTVSGVTLTAGSITGTTGTLTSASDFDVHSGTITAALGGGVGLTKTTTGAVTIGGLTGSTYTGATAILDGTLRVTANAPSGAPGALGNTTSDVLLGDTGGSSSVTLIAGAGGAGGTVTVGRNVDVRAGSSGTATIGGDVALASDAFFTGNVALSKDVTLDSANGVTTFSGAVSGSGFGVAKTGGGTMVFSGTAANTYTGPTTIHEHILVLDKSAGTNAIAGPISLGDGAGTDELRLSASDQIADTAVLTINSSGLFNLVQSSETVAALEGSGAVVFGVNVVSTLTVGDDSDRVFSGVISSGSATEDEFVKVGTGTLWLSGTNTFLGSTFVDLGTLSVTGSLAADVTVNSGGTLAGDGAVGGALTVSGGTVAPGLSPAILDSGPLDTARGGTFTAEVNGATPGMDHDQLNVTGSVTLGDGVATLELLGGYTFAFDDEIVLINNSIITDPTTGFFFGFPEGADVSFGGFVGKITYMGGDGNDVVLDTFLPETTVFLSGGDLFVIDIHGGTSDDDLTISLVDLGGGLANVRVHDPGNLVEAGADAIQVDPFTVEVPLLSITGTIQVNTLQGNDTLTVDYAGTASVLGSPLPSAGLDFDGGENALDNDQLIVAGYDVGLLTVTHTGPGAGSVEVGAGAATIRFTGLEPLTLLGTASDVVINLPASADDAVLGDGGSGLLQLESANGTFEATAFTVPTGSAAAAMLAIHGGDGADTVTINALPGFDASPVGASLTVNGDGDLDAIILNAPLNLGAGDLAFDAETINVNASISTDAGNILLSVGETNDPGICDDDLTVISGVTIQSASGAVTLLAGDDVILQAGSIVSAGGDLAIEAGFNDAEGCGAVTLGGTINAGDDLTVCAAESIGIGGPINAGGNSVRLVAGGGVAQTAGGDISAAALGVRANGAVTLLAANDVDTFAAFNAAPDGSISLHDVDDLNIGTVTANSCFTATSGVTTAGDADTVRLITTAGLTQDADAPIRASLLGVRNIDPSAGSASGNVTLFSANDVNSLAAFNAAAGGTVSFHDEDDLAIGAVAVQAPGFAATFGVATNDGDVNLRVATAGGGTLSITQAIDTRDALDTARGDVRIVSVGANATGPAVEQTSAGGISAGALGVAAADDVLLCAGDNDVNTVAIAAAGIIEVRDIDGLTVGAVAAGPGGFPGAAGLQGGDNHVNLNVGGTLMVDQPIDAGAADVRIVAGGDVTQSAGGVVTADALGIVSGGEVTLCAAVNHLATLAISAAGLVEFREADELTIGTVAAGGNCGFNGAGGISNNGAALDADVNLNASILHVEQPINAGAGDVRIVAGVIDQSATGAILADALGIVAQGSVSLHLAANDVNVLAINTTGGIVNFHDIDGYTIGTVPAGGNCGFTGASGLTNTTDITQCVADGDLIVDGPINAGAGVVRLHAENGSVIQNAGGTITGSVLGVRAFGSIILDATSNFIASTFAALSEQNSARIAFRNTLGFATGHVSADACFDQAVSGVTTNGGPVELCADAGTIQIGTAGVPSSGVNTGVGAIVRFQATSGNVTQTAEGAISSQALGVSASGSVTLTAAPNANNAIAIGASGLVEYRDVGAVAVGSVAASGCFTSDVIGVSSNGGDINLQTGDNLTLNDGQVGAGSINAGSGDVRIVSGGFVIQTEADDFIRADELGIRAAGPISLVGDNNVNLLAAQTTLGAINFRDVNALAIGTVAAGGTAGFTTTVGLFAPSADINLCVDAGGLSVFNSVQAGAGVVRLAVPGGGVTQSASSGIAASALSVQAGTFVDLDNAASAIAGTVVAVVTAGDFHFRNASGFTVGQVAGGGCVPATVTGVNVANGVVLVADTGTITIGALAAGTGITAATAALRSGGVQQTAEGNINAAGLLIQAAGAVTLCAAINDVTNLAVNTTAAAGLVEFRDGDDLTIASLSVVSTAFAATINGVTSAGGGINLRTGTFLDLVQPLNAGAGDIRMVAGTSVSRAGVGAVIADELGILAGTEVILNTGSNDVNTIAVNATGMILYTDADDLSVGTVVTGGNCGFVTTAGVVSSVQGNVVLQTLDLPTPGQDLTILTGRNVGAVDGSVGLFAGDNFTLHGGQGQASATIQASADVAIAGDVGNADAGSGSTILITGTITNGGAATITGNSEVDQITLERKGTGPITLDGVGAQDIYFVQLGNLLGVVHVIDTGASSNDFLTVNGTSNVETIVITNASVTSAAEAVNYAAIESLEVLGLGGNDVFNVRSTNAGTTTLVSGGGGEDAFTMSSDAPATSGHLDGILGPVTIDGGGGVFNRIVANDAGGAPNANVVVTESQILNLAPAVINYFATGGQFNVAGTASVMTASVLGDGIVVRGSNNGGDTFTVTSTLLGSSTRIEGLDGSDTFANGGAFADNGDLDEIRGRLTVLGGAPGPFGSMDCDANPFGTRDVLFLNDRGDGGQRNYLVGPSGVTTSVPRPFAGVFFDATMDTVRLDGTDDVNVFDTSPSTTTQFFIDGNLPPPGVCSPDGAAGFGGDFLRLNTIGTTGRHLNTASVGKGHWSFTSGHQHVCFESIERFNHVDILAVANASGPPLVRVYDAETLEFRFQVLAYEGFFRGGVRVATGDVNCDGLPDLVTAPGPGRRATVRAFNGAPDSLGQYPAQRLASFNAYRPQFTRGVFVAIADVNGDGANDIITGADAGWLPMVSVFSGMTLTTAPSLIGSFRAFGNRFRGGVRVAAGDINNDGRAEIIAATGPGTSARVNVYDGASFGLVNSFAAFGRPYKNGLFAAIGDVNGDGIRDVVASAGGNWLPLVSVFSGGTVYGGAVPQQLARFRVFNNRERTGVRIAVKAVDGGQPGNVEKVNIMASSGPGGGRVSRKVVQASYNGLTPAVVDRVFENARVRRRFVFNGIYVG